MKVYPFYHNINFLCSYEKILRFEKDFNGFSFVVKPEVLIKEIHYVVGMNKVYNTTCFLEEFFIKGHITLKINPESSQFEVSLLFCINRK